MKRKGGRRISGANQKLLQEALDHYERAVKCIGQVLDSNELDGDQRAKLVASWESATLH